MSNNLIQSTSQNWSSLGGDGSKTKAFTSNTTTGNTLVVCVMLEITATDTTTVTVSDNINGTYSLPTSAQGTGDEFGLQKFRGWIFYFPNVTGGATTVTVNYSTGSNTADELNVFLREYTNMGVNPFEAWRKPNIGQYAFPIPFSGLTTMNYNDVIVALFWERTGGETWTSADPDTKNVDSVSGTNTSVGCGDLLAPTPGSYTLSASDGINLHWGSMCIALIDPTSGAMTTNLIGSSGGSLTLASDKYNVLYGANSNWGTQITTQSVMPVSGYLNNFYIACDAGPGAGISRTFRIENITQSTNGPSITLTGAGTGAGISTGNDTTTTLAFSAGDVISIHSTATAGTTDAGTVKWAIGSISGPNTSMLISDTGGSTGTTFPVYIGLQGLNVDTASSNNVETIMPTAGTIKNAYVRVNTAYAAATGVTYTLYLNGIAQSLAVTLTAVISGSDTNAGHAVAVVAGDRLYWKATTASGAPASKTVAISAEFDPTINGESVHTYGSSRAQPSSSRSQTITANDGGAYSTTPGPAQVLSLAATWQKLYVYLQSDPSPGTYTYSVTIATDQTLSVARSASGQGSDTTHTPATTNGQVIYMVDNLSSSPAASLVEWGVVSYIAPAQIAYNHFLTLLGVGC